MQGSRFRHTTALAQKTDHFELDPLPIRARASSTRPVFLRQARQPALLRPEFGGGHSPGLLFDHLARLGTGAQLALIDKACTITAATIGRGDEFVFAPGPDMPSRVIEDKRPRATLAALGAGQRQRLVTSILGQRTGRKGQQPTSIHPVRITHLSLTCPFGAKSAATAAASSTYS